MNTNKVLIPIIMGLVVLVSGCGGGGSSAGGGISYDGNTSPAGIDATNAELIGKAAGESIQVADGTTQLPVGISGTSTDLTPLNTVFVNAAISSLETSPNLPAGITQDISYLCSSGSASVSYTSNATSGPLSATETFNNCVLLDAPAIKVSGRVEVYFSDISDPFGTGFTFTYSNFTMTDSVNATTFTLNVSMDCPAGLYSLCVIAADFSGSDGTVHRVANFSIYGDSVFGYDGTATFYHGTYGEVSITATAITYGSCGAYPDGGTVDLNSTDGSSASVIFNSDCTTSGTWTNATGSGSF
ncbi:MAG: hypothetical protein OEY29_14995 [Gammaproteobacteria bacterium]|nr:hypothetical protein [Gammaproteobacteria bacterium]